MGKLSKFVTKIGYPDKWRDFSALELVPGDLFENLRRTGAFDADWLIARKGQPVDKSEWLTPQTVNAYYMPPANEIVFPAAILQPPYFNPDADDAANYGNIGMIIVTKLVTVLTIRVPAMTVTASWRAGGLRRITRSSRSAPPHWWSSTTRTFRWVWMRSST